MFLGERDGEWIAGRSTDEMDRACVYRVVNGVTEPKPYITWDAQLVEAGELIKAKPMLTPGWLFILDVS
ncbi:hypothetical protein [Streptomyces sp. NPDC003032]